MRWMQRAECARRRSGDGKPFYDAELWQPIGTTGSSVPQIEDAKRVCFRCPVRGECLTYALSLPVDSGILGGLTEGERASLKRRQARVRAKAGPPVRTDLIPAFLGAVVINRTGLSNKEIARRTGIHKDTVSKIRRGVSQWVEPGTLGRLEALAAVTA